MNVMVPDIDASAMAWFSRGDVVMSIGSLMATMTADEAKNLADDLLTAVAEHEARSA